MEGFKFKKINNIKFMKSMKQVMKLNNDKCIIINVKQPRHSKNVLTSTKLTFTTKL